ncbi:MAG: hypothetical protein CW716_06900 [Candidatus Bathyarchaeum sp.]|jgi:hypothetical protein|nr:MAG: hypothetical protein CW716_06900 [Candidatus Bathyarchaeum sp.]
MGPDGVDFGLLFGLDDTFNFGCIYLLIFCLMVLKDKLPMENPYDRFLPKTKSKRKYTEELTDCTEDNERENSVPLPPDDSE